MRASMVFSILMSRARVGGWTSRPLTITHPRALGHRAAQRLLHAAAPLPYISRLADETTSSEPQLRLLNSLTQRADPFVPIDARLVKWYICGPTVYDSAHVGHARNYVAFDIVRRVLRDYFGFDLLYVMNITDIDDKIILRAHRNHLEASLRALAGADGVDAARRAAERVLEAAKPSLAELMEAQQQLCDAADAAALGGVTPCDVHAAFLELTAHFEKEFFDDMAALNVLPPDAVTRVSDYVPEVVAYIEKIMANGYCYESNGSVYFDTAAFRASGKPYGKLDPTKVGAEEGKSVRELLDEGEGALSADGGADKRQPADFVLWKASKRGEPAWPSPWGAGRPGWHIECSAMASDLLGDAVDLNAGGSDLKFPHHENQLAQAEAHFDCCAWVNYFLHSGHLKIEGLKMSKSLKNFITVRAALGEYSASQLRFLFLLRPFFEPMEYSANSMRAAVDLERRFASFTASLDARLREAADLERGGAPPRHKWGAAERRLHESLHEKRRAVHAALCASVDTAAALKALEQLLRATNTYMRDVPDAAHGATLLAAVRRYFSQMLRTFGVEAEEAGGGGGGGGGEALAAALSSFRDEVRREAIAMVKGGDGGSVREAGEALLQACDVLRDDVLPAAGMLVEDRASGKAQFKLDEPHKLVAEVERKREAAAKAAAEKEAKAAAREAAAALEAARAAIPPLEMFEPKHDRTFEREESFGGIDQDGIPTLDGSGEPLSKSTRKKLRKQLEKHAKTYAAHLEK